MGEYMKICKFEFIIGCDPIVVWSGQGMAQVLEHTQMHLGVRHSQIEIHLGH